MTSKAFESRSQASASSLIAHHEGAVDVVIIGGSAGALSALRAVFQGLPAGFATPTIVMLHLPPDFPLMLTPNRLVLPVQWAKEGQVLKPGDVLLCPPRKFVELLPDGSCKLSHCEGGAVDKPIDRLLSSVARSFGDRALGVVLTGMGGTDRLAHWSCSVPAHASSFRPRLRPSIRRCPMQRSAPAQPRWSCRWTNSAH